MKKIIQCIEMHVIKLHYRCTYKCTESIKMKNQVINLNYLYSAGGIASAWHSNDAPEYNNAVVNRSGPTALIIGGSMKNQLILRLTNKVINKKLF